MADPNPYYDNFDTVVVNSGKSKSQKYNNREYASIAKYIKWLQAKHNIQIKYTKDVKIYSDLEINLTTKIDSQYILQNQLVEDFAHVLSCEKNEKTIEKVINKFWQKYYNKKKIQCKDSDTKELCTTVKKINIEEKLPFGVITEEILVLSNNRKESVKQTIAVLYRVITEI
ncbi:24244_t:CDS:2, partial [Gigaspora margarita]